MSCSTSSSSRAGFARALLALLLLSGCAPTDRQRTVVLETRPRAGLIAVLPVQNLTGGRAPLAEVAGLVRSSLELSGFSLVGADELEDFMRKYRVRHTGGLNGVVSKAIREETGATAYLVTSLEAYDTRTPPRLSLFARLVSSGERPEILWMDSVGVSGEAHPGLLGMGLVLDPEVLLTKAVRCLADSLGRSRGNSTDATRGASSAAYPACGPRAELTLLSPERGADKQHRPRILFRGPTFGSEQSHRFAVIPFLNLSDRTNAGRIVTLHFINQLIRSPQLSIVEPGLVREQLLKFRVIMQAGPSLDNAETIGGPDSLGVDQIFSGTVFHYQDEVPIPRVDFSVNIIDATSRRLVWSSRSFGRGDDRVVFFDVGRVYTAHNLASRLAWGTFDALIR
jgi:TolB-like protein